MFLTETEIGKSIRFMILKAKQTQRQMASLCSRNMGVSEKLVARKEA